MKPRAAVRCQLNACKRHLHWRTDPLLSHRSPMETLQGQQFSVFSVMMTDKSFKSVDEMLCEMPFGNLSLQQIADGFSDKRYCMMENAMLLWCMVITHHTTIGVISLCPWFSVDFKPCSEPRGSSCTVHCSDNAAAHAKWSTSQLILVRDRCYKCCCLNIFQSAKQFAQR